MVLREELNLFDGSHRELVKRTVSTIMFDNMSMVCIIRMGVLLLINKLNSHLEKKAHREISNTD